MFIVNVLIMLANDPSSFTMERVYQQNAKQNISVQHISVFLHIPFVIVDPNNLSTIYILIMYAADTLTNVDGLASISHFTIHSTQMQERWFWLRGRVVPFQLNARPFII